MSHKQGTPTIESLISSYPILEALASWISTLDLYHLARTNKSNSAYIKGSPGIFRSLRRLTLCDGRGLKLRQQFQPPYRRASAGKWTINPFFDGDEEIEVAVYSVKCDEAGALPCLKCEVPICEECRCYPRAAPPNSYPNRRPHLTGSFELQNIMALCDSCDSKMESEVRGKFLEELCDCDRYTRWICTPCTLEERDFQRDYFKNHTLMEWNWPHPEDDDDEDYYAPSKYTTDHQHDRAFWCLCGEKVKDDTLFRCTWCKRRHLPESDWYDEYVRVGKKIPFFEDNPNYPRWREASQDDRHYPKPYPRLGYARPGDEITEPQDHE